MATIGQSQPKPLDNPILEATANELSFFDRVRFEQLSVGFARLTFSDCRRLQLTIKEKFHGLRYEVGVRRRMEPRKDGQTRVVTELKGLEQMLLAVMARVNNWHSISLEHMVFGKQRLIPILVWLSEVVKVSGFTASFRFRQKTPEAGEMERLTKWITKYSPQLHHLSLHLHVTMDSATVALINNAIKECQELHRLHIRDSSIYDSTAFRDILVQSLPKLNGFSTRYRSSAHSLSIDSSWLDVCAQPIFHSLLGRMNTFKLDSVYDIQIHLPLPPASLSKVTSVISAMQPPVKIEIFNAKVSGEVTLDKILEQWLPLAQNRNANIDLYSGDWRYLSIVAYVAAMAALPAHLQDGRLRLPTLADIEIGRQWPTFYYMGGGGKVVLSGCSFDDDEATLTLKLLCEKRLLRMVAVDNACQLFKVANESDSDSVKKAAGKLIWQQLKTIDPEDLVGWNQYMEGHFALLKELCKMGRQKLF